MYHDFTSKTQVTGMFTLFLKDFDNVRFMCKINKTENRRYIVGFIFSRPKELFSGPCT